MFATALSLCLQLTAIHGASSCQALPAIQAPRTGRYAAKFDWTVSKASFRTKDGSKAIITHSAPAAYTWAIGLANDEMGRAFGAVHGIGDPLRRGSL